MWFRRHEFLRESEGVILQCDIVCMYLHMWNEMITKYKKVSFCALYKPLFPWLSRKYKLVPLHNCLIGLLSAMTKARL